MKEIVPHKIIIELDTDGTMKDAIMQYRLRHNGAMLNKFYTMSIKDGFSLPAINTQLQKVKEHVEMGEKIRPIVPKGEKI